MSGGGGAMVFVDEEELAADTAKALIDNPPSSLDEFEGWAKKVALSPEKVFEERVKLFGAEKRRAAWGVLYGKLMDKLDAVANAPKVKGQKSLHSDVIWEKIDPKHRTSVMLAMCYQAYEDRKPVQEFFEWLDAMPEFERVKLIHGKGNGSIDKSHSLAPSAVVAFVKGVKYLDEGARASYAVAIDRGIIRRDGKPFDTGGMSTCFSGVGWAIFVQSPKTKVFYTGSHTMGLFHHSTFLSGEPVLSAGEWKIKDGKLQVITPKSGHYQPSLGEIGAALTTLQDAGADLSQTQVQVYKDKKKTFLSASAFLASDLSQYKAWDD